MTQWYSDQTWQCPKAHVYIGGQGWALISYLSIWIDSKQVVWDSSVVLIIPVTMSLKDLLKISSLEMFMNMWTFLKTKSKTKSFRWNKGPYFIIY